MKEVIDSARYVIRNSRHVRINRESVRNLAEQIASRPFTIPQWDQAHHYFDGTEKTLHYLFVLDTLNFCFWPQPGHERWAIKYKDEELSGYYALAEALKEAFTHGYPLHDPAFLASMKMADLEEILSGKGHLQLMKERLLALQELGTYLVVKWQGSPAKLVEACEGSAVNLAKKVGNEISSFRDVGQYNRRRVYFYKRAQILAADIYGAFNGKGWGKFYDMEGLTAFADYKLPQVLRELGVLTYSPKLAAKIDSRRLIPQGSIEEIEIRAHTIWAVELLCAQLRQGEHNIRAFEMDWILWNLGQQDTYRKKPYHRTVTIYY
ncbi:MAG: hypothetical protein DRG76_04975 [Deltaproteobacteria bacterium]|nr:MAG: hypothetical protein DRG76_04975 [Deltaproteobacteria bacterium]